MYQFKILTYIVIIALTITFTGSDASRRTDLNQAISIDYGTVDYVEREHLKSDAGKNAVFGGLLGAATGGKKHKGKHALEGALALGIITAITERKHKAFAYHVILNNGSVVKILTEHKGIVGGDCVALERGRKSNIRRVSSAYCDHPNHPVFQQQDVINNAQDDAAVCQQAKDKLMAAETANDVDIAAKKVQVFCGH